MSLSKNNSDQQLALPHTEHLLLDGPHPVLLPPYPTPLLLTYDPAVPGAADSNSTSTSTSVVNPSVGAPRPKL